MSNVAEVRRTLSGTALERSHERTRNARKAGSAHWPEFSRQAYPAEALALAKDQALCLAEGEYASIGLFGQILSGLAHTGAPFDIVSAASLVSSDEARHADDCLRFAELCAGRDLALEIDRDALDSAVKQLSDEETVDHYVLKYSAIGETLAGALLHACRDGASDLVAKALYGSLLRDEVHHARLGWYYFTHRAPRLTQPERQRLADGIAEFVVGLEQNFWFGRDAQSPSTQAAATALGVLDTERQRLTLARVMEEEIIPGLDSLGLGGSAMWAARRRGVDATYSVPSFVIAERRRALHVEAAGAPSEAELRRALDKVRAAADSGAAWLAHRVGADGALTFGLDPASGEPAARRAFHHGRATIALAALELHGGHQASAAALRERLLDDLLHQRPLVAEHAPSPAQLAGTYALAVVSGLPVQDALALASEDPAVLEPDAWHAAQVACALGAKTPYRVWKHCQVALERFGFAPWTLRAASALGDEVTARRAAKGLLASLANLSEAGVVPHGLPPSLAEVAACLEALAGVDLSFLGAREPAARDSVRRGRDYLVRYQFSNITGLSLVPEAQGGFPLSPSDPYLRTDVTAHAVLALTKP